jgi:hypothetical protein
VHRASPNTDLRQAKVDNLLGRLRSLDLRIARMRILHSGSCDTLAHRLIGRSIAERAEIQAKLAVRRSYQALSGAARAAVVRNWQGHGT